jgi:pyrroline-5-carboxylate reductase
MAKAIIMGLIKKNYKIEVIGRNKDKLSKLQKELPQISIAKLQDNFDITSKNIIFAVKPFNLVEVGTKLKGVANNFYSVLAGTTIKDLKQNISAKYYVRVMPNISAKFNKSMTTLTGDKKLKDEAIEIFEAIGQTLWVETEKELNIATAIAGSGPAFLAYFANAIIESGIEAGLKKDDAIALNAGLFDGFIPLLNENKPNNIIKKVMSPNGTTEAGYNYLIKNNVEKHIKNTIKTAYNKALKLANINND